MPQFEIDWKSISPYMAEQKPRPLDIIPELIGAGYMIAPKSAFYTSDRIYETDVHVMKKNEVIELVKTHGNLLFVRRASRVGLPHHDKFSVDFVVVNKEPSGSVIKLQVS